MRRLLPPPVLDADEVREPSYDDDVRIGFKRPGSVAVIQRVGEHIRLGLQRDVPAVDVACRSRASSEGLLTVLECRSGGIEGRSPVLVGVLAFLF